MNRIYAALWASLILGLLLWLDLATDYSWDNVWIDACFAQVVGLIGLVVWKRSKEVRHQWLRRAACLPSMIGGLPYIVLTAVAMIPPIIVIPGFWVGEQLGSSLIQRAVSPDRTRIAEVYFKPVGAYSGGNGRIEVHLKYAWLPLIKRDVYSLGKSYAEGRATDYLQWLDNDTLYIPEAGTRVRLGMVKLQMPVIIGLLLHLLG